MIVLVNSIYIFMTRKVQDNEDEYNLDVLSTSK